MKIAPWTLMLASHRSIYPEQYDGLATCLNERVIWLTPVKLVKIFELDRYMLIPDTIKSIFSVVDSTYT